MDIEFRCTACGKLLRVPEGTAGRQAKCPVCGAGVTIPEPAPAESAPPGPGAAAGEENPYQSPGHYAGAPPPLQGYAYAVDRDFAAAQVAAPATWLIVTGALGFPACLASAVVNLAQFGEMGFGPGPNVNDPAFLVFAGGYGVLTAGLGIVMSVLVIVGAVKMKRLESYGLAMTSAVIALCPCISPCCLLGLPFGIWAITVLCDARVKAAFRR